MKSVAFSLLLAAIPAIAVTSAHADSGINVIFTDIPAGATEVVVLVDTIAPPVADDYEERQAARAAHEAAVRAALAAGQPAPPEPRRQRREAAPPKPVYRHARAVDGASSLTIPVAVPAADGYRLRAVVMKGDGMYPSVLSGGRLMDVKVDAAGMTDAIVSLATPKIELLSDMPTTVKAGSTYTLAGKITDPAGILGNRNRMRVWISPNVPVSENYAGTQTSTVDVTTDLETGIINFTFTLTAPTDANMLYFQFGEVGTEFVREDRRQAPFLVAPDFNTGASPLQLRVEVAAR